VNLKERNPLIGGVGGCSVVPVEALRAYIRRAQEA
jgi:hypothetical protein